MKNINRKLKLLLSIALLHLTGCGLNPQNADVDINRTLPEAKVTIYQQAINKLGLMNFIYGSPSINIMANDITDNTGTSVATNAEIPRDITVMVKSTLNGIGGNITFIPYDANLMANMINTGYTEFADKRIPDVIVSGGITEFDRGLVTKGDSLDLDVEFAKEYGISFSDENKGSLAQVTLDFNLIDFRTFAGIPRIQAVNGIKLHKGVKEDSFGFTIKSATFGAKGTIKKVQGRHAAVRLLVQLSMVQIIGRYQKVPYWRLIPGATKDQYVIDQVLSDFYEKTNPEKIAAIQTFLYLHGHELKVSGQMDGATEAALQSFAQDHNITNPGINQDTYLVLFETTPIDIVTKFRRKTLPKVTLAVLTLPQPSRTMPLTKAPESQTGSIKLWTDKTEYQIGDSMQVNFSVDEPMYVRIVDINAQGEVATLFPNAYQSDNYCVPGKVYSIPSPGAGFSLDIGGPAGTDKLRAVASKNPIPAEALYFTADGDFDDNKMAKLASRSAVDIVIR